MCFQFPTNMNASAAEPSQRDSEMLLSKSAAAGHTLKASVYPCVSVCVCVCTSYTMFFFSHSVSKVSKRQPCLNNIQLTFDGVKPTYN